MASLRCCHESEGEEQEVVQDWELEDYWEGWACCSFQILSQDMTR